MVAGLLLCKRNHQCQCDSQVFQWMDLMRGRGRQFGLLTPSPNPVNWAAFVAARPSGLTAPPEAAPISRTPRPTQAASVAASETGPRLETPFSSPEWTEPPNQATSVAAAEADEIKCLICWQKDGDLRKCLYCSALMHPNCQVELQQAAKHPWNQAEKLGKNCPHW
jgi:hypothetical protein